METLLPLYDPAPSPLLAELLDTPPLRRLADVGMNCGCEYTAFPLFARTLPYSRRDHSAGAARIVWHFTASPTQAAAALLHDVATPVFAHTVDFLHGDHLRQESTEADTAAVIAASPEVTAVLARYGLDTADVSDYHRYPIADNDSPRLSADRLEYTLGNLFHYGFADLTRLSAFYRDLTVSAGEDGQPELAFCTPEIAQDFALGSTANRTGVRLRRGPLCHGSPGSTAAGRPGSWGAYSGRPDGHGTGRHRPSPGRHCLPAPPGIASGVFTPSGPLPGNGRKEASGSG